MQQIGNQIKATWYQTSYNYRALFQYEVEELAYLLGERVINKQQVQNIVFNTFRFTYREGFPAYKCNETIYNTDSGWGCMIRVGQMMMAALIKRHLKAFYDFDIMFSQSLLNELLDLFNDNDQEDAMWYNDQKCTHQFSIQKIMRISYKEFNKKPGEWYSPNQIVQSIHKILSNNQIKFTYGFGFVPCYESQLDLQLIIQEMCMMEKCQCKKQLFNIKGLLANLEKIEIHQNEEIEVMHNGDHLRKLSSEDYSQQDKNRIKEVLFNFICFDCFKWRRAVSICLLSRIGCDEPNPDYVNIIIEFMKKHYFTGMLGGRPKEANFILGFVDNKFVVLDPHLVQPSNLSKEEYFHTCFPKEVMFMGDKEIDCSLGLLFYLNDLQDLIQLIYDVLLHRANSFFFFGQNLFNKYSGVDFTQQTQLIDEFRKSLPNQQYFLNISIYDQSNENQDVHSDSSYEKFE